MTCETPTAPTSSAPPDADAAAASRGPGAGGVVLLGAGLIGNLIFGASTLALPAVESALGLTTATGTLVVALFSVGFAASLVLGGRLGDSLGRRRVLRLALIATVPASLLVALAPGAGVLLVGRAAQGAASGLLLPQVLATIQHTTTGAARSRWTGAYAAVIGAGTAIGQIGAGLLVTADPFGIGWRLSFGVVAGVALLVLALSGTVPESRSGVRAHLDPLGALLLGAAITAIVLPLGMTGALASPGAIAALIVLALVLLAAFGLWEHRRTPARALVPLTALGVRPLQVGLALTVVFFGGYGAFVYYVSSTLEAGMGLGALTTAMVLLPFACGFVAMSASLPALLVRLPARRVMRTAVAAQAVLLASIAAVVVAGGAHASLVLLCALLTILGVAQAAMYGPLIGTVMGALDHDLAGLASGLFSTLQQVGIALGVPLFGLILAAIPTDPALAFAACVGAQVLLAGLFAVLVGRLPAGPRQRGPLSAARG